MTMRLPSGPVSVLRQWALIRQRRRRRRQSGVRAAVFANPVRLERNAALTGVTNSRSGVFSAWVRPGATSAIRAILSDTLGDNTFTLGITNRFQVKLEDSVGATVISANSNVQLTDTRWHHVLATWDTTQATAADRLRMFIDGVEDTLIPTVNQGLDIDYAGQTNWRVGGQTGGASNLNGALAQLVFAPGQWLDLTDPANVALFIKDGRPPERLNLSFSPAIRLESREVDPAAMAANLGTGGPLAIEGGSLRRHDGPPIRVGA